MDNPQTLHLVRPEAQSEPNANVSAIASYIARLIFLVCPPREIFSTELLKFNHPDLVEIWYWFDSLNLTHRIVFWGENLPSPMW